MRTIARLTLLVSLAGVTASALAADPVPIEESELAATASWGAKKDRAVVLECVKFRGFFAPNVEAGSIPDDRLFLADGPCADGLAGNRIGAEKLVKGRSNVRIAGIARDAGGHRTIDVTAVTAVARDAVLFARRAAALAPEDADGRARLAALARARAAAFADDELLEWARRTDEEALDRKCSARPKGDATAAIALARGYVDLAAVTSKAIAVLADAVADAGLAEGDRARLVHVLEGELKASRHHGRWISHDELEAALGLVRDGTRWVRKERLELEQVAGAWVDVPTPRPLTETQYETAAGKGELAIGMTKPEVAHVKGRGLPAAVDRLEKGTGASAVTFDQWVMADGSRLYFARGMVFAWKP